MNWTTDTPTEDGFYWRRKNKYKHEGMYYVFTSRHESIAKENSQREKEGVELLSRYDPITAVRLENRVFYCRWVGETLCDKQRLEEVGGEWHGPLKPPE